MTTTTTVDKLALVLSGIRELARSSVMVGVPSDRAGRRSEGGQTINNAAIGYIHENGAPEVGIPARPHMIPGILEGREGVETSLRGAAEAALDGRGPAVVDRYLHAAGLRGQAAVRRKITTGPFLPLAPGTLASRRRRGRTGTKPLIDTGQYRNAITYVIRRT